MRTSGYFNAASHGVPEVAVYERVVEYLSCEADMGPDGAAEHWTEQLQDVRRSAATLLGGKADEVGFSATTTTAWLAMLARMDLAGKRVLVAPHDWGDFYRALKQRGDVTVEVLPVLSGENPDLAVWAARMGGDVAAMFVPMVTAVGGFRYPVEAIGALPRPEQMKYIIDGAQALGQMPVDVDRIGCDVFVSTARKWLCGPRQTSLVWVGEGCDFTGSDLEPADKNNALLLGLGVAIDHFLHVGADTVQTQIMARSDVLRDWARAHDVAVEAGQTGSVSLKLGVEQGAEAMRTLSEAGIAAKLLNVGHFEPMVFADAQGRWLRLSPHVYTKDTDIEALLRVLTQVLML